MNYKIDGVKNFKQYDTRWSKLSYRVLPACVRLNGCGAAALADISTAIPEHKKKTVKNSRKWLLEHGYVSANQGTYHAGIAAHMKAHGFEDVKEHATMTELFKYMSKEKRVGVILFTKGTKGGRTYTSSGHFCAIKGYKEVKGKHYLYICDPGPRNNNGFICYETEMKGLVYKVWTGRIPGTKKATKTEKEPAKKTATYKGFDISYVQNGLDKKDFVAAKKAGWDFVIIRLGTVLNGSLYTDQEFESKYKNAKAAGLDIGIYFYSMAKTVADAKKEANYVIKKLDNRKLQYPVFIDYEDPSLKNIKNKKEICEAFCAVIEKAGYDAGVYASYDWLTNRMEKISTKYYVWLAQYPRATYKGRYEMHQYSSSGKVTGIGKTIDVNVTTIKPTNKPVTKKTEKKVVKEPEKKTEPKEEKTVKKAAKTNAEKLADKATKFAYVSQKKAGKYPDGKPKKAYQEALDKYYKDRSTWGKATRAGASCDVFIGTVIRAAKVDPKFPRALEKDFDYLEKSELFDEVKNPTLEKLENGDVIIYKKKSGGAHICMYVDGKIKEASHEKWYGITTDTAKSRLSMDGKKYRKVYRAK